MNDDNPLQLEVSAPTLPFEAFSFFLRRVVRSLEKIIHGKPLMLYFKKRTLAYCLIASLLSGCYVASQSDKSPNPFQNADVTERNGVVTSVIPLEKLENELYGPRVVIRSTKELQQLTGLDTRRLRLEPTTISSENLTLLSEMKQLIQLDLHDTPFTDENVHQIRSLKQLSMLDLSGTKITDAALPILASMKISDLNLARTDITSDGVFQLVQSGRPLALDISSTRIEPDIGKKLIKCDFLEDLDLSNTSINNETIEDLSKNRCLTSLHMENTQVDDEAIPSILKHRSFRILSLAGTGITDLGQSRIRKGLPKCHINR